MKEDDQDRLNRIKAQMQEHGQVDSRDMEWMAWMAQYAIEAMKLVGEAQ